MKMESRKEFLKALWMIAYSTKLSPVFWNIIVKIKNNLDVITSCGCIMWNIAGVMV